MRLRHIEVFHAIYSTGSITNAAKILHVSQPSVSKVLAHAEMQLGFQLFERVKGRLIPTNEAEMLFDEADKIYQQMRSINNTAENIKKSEYGNISIAVTPALGFDVLPVAIANFQQAHPKVNFQVQTVHNDEVMQSLYEHKCDIAVVFSPTAMAGVVETVCDQSELVVMYPKSLFPSEPTSLNLTDLKDLPFIDISDSGPLGDQLWTRMMKENIKLQSTIKVQTYFIAARMVANGAGVCVVDKYTAYGNAMDDVAYASFEPRLSFNVSMLHLENRRLSVAADDFMEFLNKQIQSI
ncbi:LysR family transcriptional regulator [Thalassotalea euphylliae]|uniref:LysR family transcriptional regulator n=1 Tax=Thalassotalea euphylliae TaxID=1655234 RepID=A0A3E0U0B1_9GAMM|nr:LysR family transcriptional regulator [Thalassotalea euphylliae]REL29655.1 LysR family transcriptional regulator [Thalassotalea euphylliae]